MAFLRQLLDQRQFPLHASRAPAEAEDQRSQNKEDDGQPQNQIRRVVRRDEETQQRSIVGISERP